MPKIDQSLRAVLIAAGNGDAAVGTKGIALPLIARDGERYVAHVLPLTSGARRRAGIATSAAAILTVHRAALDIPSPPEAIARAYALTPTELRVLLAIVEIGGAPEVAAALGIGDTTVRTHLARLYEKTGTKRQADLVKLVAGFSTAPASGRLDDRPLGCCWRRARAKPRSAEGIQEVDQIALLLAGKADTEPLVIEIHDIQQASRPIHCGNRAPAPPTRAGWAP